MVQAIPMIISAATAVGSFALTRYQAQMEMAVARQQAEELKISAQQERAASHIEAARKRSENQFKIGETKAALGGSGFTLDDATAANIISGSVAEATLSERLIIAQGDQRARNVEAQARNTLWGGKMTKKAGNLSAIVGLGKDTASWFDTYGNSIVNGTG